MVVLIVVDSGLICNYTHSQTLTVMELIDRWDACIDEPENFNDYLDWDGCPDIPGVNH